MLFKSVILALFFGDVQLLVDLLVQHYKRDRDDREERIQGEDLLEVVPEVLLWVGEGFVACHVFVWEFDWLVVFLGDVLLRVLVL